MSKNEAHSGHAVWLIYKYKAILRLVPALGKKGHAQLIFTILMILLAAVGATGFGIVIDGYVISPPVQERGLCAPPAYITNNGVSCLESITYYQTSSGSTITKTTIVNTGQVYPPGSNLP